MKKLLTLLLVLITCSVSAIDMGPYDPGAARKSDLGTMAAEAATDYVATDTFTGHTGATGASVHGLGTISTFASTDYVATSSLAERLDTANASFTGDIDVTGDVGAATLGVTGHSTLTTASATAIAVSSNAKINNLIFSASNIRNESDGDSVTIFGGSTYDPARGATIRAYGTNSSADTAGNLYFDSGNVATQGAILFRTNSSTDRMKITNSGNVLIGTTTDDGVNKLQVNGGARSMKTTAIGNVSFAENAFATTSSAASAVLVSGTLSTYNNAHVSAVVTLTKSGGLVSSWRISGGVDRGDAGSSVVTPTTQLLFESVPAGIATPTMTITLVGNDFEIKLDNPSFYCNTGVDTTFATVGSGFQYFGSGW